MSSTSRCGPKPARCPSESVVFHSDATQSVGKIPTRVDDLGVDLLSIAGHKFQAPKGVGALYVRQGVTLEPLLHGAGHEGGRRAGTESALLAAGLGAACRLAADLSPMTRVEALRERLWQGLQARLGECVVRFGDPSGCLPNTLGCAFVGQCGGGQVTDYAINRRQWADVSGTPEATAASQKGAVSGASGQGNAGA